MVHDGDIEYLMSRYLASFKALRKQDKTQNKGNLKNRSASFSYFTRYHEHNHIRG